jgi:hypothetical protein
LLLTGKNRRKLWHTEEDLEDVILVKGTLIKNAVEAIEKEVA